MGWIFARILFLKDAVLPPHSPMIQCYPSLINDTVLSPHSSMIQCYLLINALCYWASQGIPAARAAMGACPLTPDLSGLPR